jgi:HEAT repeat protein
MPSRRVPRSRSAGSSSVPVVVVLAVALSSGALGAFGDRLVERSRDVFARAPVVPALLADGGVSAPAGAAPRSFPREASALRAQLRAPAAPTVTAELLGRLGLLGDRSDVRLIEGFLSDRSPLVRQAALQALARVGGEAGVERAAAWARGPMGDPDVYPAIMALAASEHGAAEDVLVQLAEGGEQWRRDAAMSGLSMRGGARARQILHRELTNGPMNQAWSAAYNVARLGEPVDARVLMRVASGSGQRADAALGALSGVPGADVDAFLVQLAREAKGERRGQLLSALGAVRDPEALAVLQGALLGPARWRGPAWSALGASEVPGALDVLLQSLPDARPGDAASVAGALAARPEPEAREALRALAAGADALADAALGALASVEDGETTELLLARYDEEGRLPPSEAFVFLATRGGDEGWELMEEVLAEGSQGDRGSVIWALQMRGDEDARDRLLALARGGDPALAPQALGALEGMGEEARDSLRALLVERVEAGEVNDWGQSMQTLARLGGDEARDLLLRRVHDGTSQERGNAVAALAQMDDPAARAALADVFHTSEDPALKSQALSHFLWSPDGMDPELLEAALQDDDPSIVAQVVGALPQAGGADTQERLLAFAGSDDPSIRGAALGALAQTGGADAEAALVSALDDPEVAQQAVWNLQSLGTQGARTALRDAAQSDDPSVRSAAIGALGMDPTPEADAILRSGLEADDEQVVLAAVSALQSRGNSAAGEALAELLTSLDEDSSPQIRSQTAWALSAIGGRFAEEHAALIEEIQGGSGTDYGFPEGEWIEGEAFDLSDEAMGG